MLRILLATGNIFVSLVLGAIAFGFVFIKYPDTMGSILDAAARAVPGRDLGRGSLAVERRDLRLGRRPLPAAARRLRLGAAALAPPRKRLGLRAGHVERAREPALRRRFLQHLDLLDAMDHGRQPVLQQQADVLRLEVALQHQDRLVDTLFSQPQRVGKVKNCKSVGVGQRPRVERGQPLLIVEAMKMEHTIAAPADGVVKQVRYRVGEQVEEGAELVDFEKAEA